MKKLFLCLILLMPVFVFAQSAENSTFEHLTFKGIQIDGNLKQLISKLENQNFTLIKEYDELAKMKGTFANSSCELLIGTTPKSKKVYTILVDFGENDSWYSLKIKYKELKTQLQNKYNVIPEATEEFYSPYYEGDGYELQALRKDKCFYYSIFKLNNGEIGLYIAEDGVRIQYTDKINNLLRKEEENFQAYDDL